MANRRQIGHNASPEEGAFENAALQAPRPKQDLAYSILAEATEVTGTVVRARMRLAAEESGISYSDIGVGMGFAKSGAAPKVSRLLDLKLDYDPRLSTVIAFAKALGRDPQHFLKSP